MAGISSKAPGKLQNKHKYNGNELQRGEFSDGVGLEVYDFNARTLDPQIGRFLQIDPAIEEDQESWTPYHFGFNNPVLHNDPDGRNPIAIYRVLRILYEVAMWAPKKGVVPQRAISIGIKDNTNVVTSAMPLELVKDFQQQGQVVKSEGATDDKSSVNELEKEIKSLEKSAKSLDKNVKEHEEKLENYKQDPDKHDNKGELKNVSPELRQKKIEGRVSSLKKQIEKNQKELEKTNREINQKRQELEQVKKEQYKTKVNE